MSGIPFQSKLEPHFNFILELRRKRLTWHAIAHELAGKGVAVTPQAIYGFTKRRLKRRYPLGMEPTASMLVAETNSKPSRPELPKLTELPPPPSDGAPDPLTLPPITKKPKWNQI
jgi:hypothetical protein